MCRRGLIHPKDHSFAQGKSSAVRHRIQQPQVEPGRTCGPKHDRTDPWQTTSSQRRSGGRKGRESRQTGPHSNMDRDVKTCLFACLGIQGDRYSLNSAHILLFEGYSKRLAPPPIVFSSQRGNHFASVQIRRPSCIGISRTRHPSNGQIYASTPAPDR